MLSETPRIPTLLSKRKTQDARDFIALSRCYVVVLAAMLCSSHSLWAATTVVFQKSASVTAGPFPTDALTVADKSTATGERINLLADEVTCSKASSQSVCSNQSLLNQLDGFSINPRVMVCFSSSIDTSTITNGIKIVSVGAQPSVISLNQVIVDGAKNCVFAKPNQVLDQETQYVLAVTDAVKDSSGSAVLPDAGFTTCLGTQGSRGGYCTNLSSAVKKAQKANLPGNIVGGSLFTTMSTTSWLEDAHDFVGKFLPAIALPAGFPYVFPVSTLNSIAWQPDRSGLGPQIIPRSAIPNVKSIAFGLYFSPNYLDSNATITTAPSAPIPTQTSIDGLISPFVPISFHVFLPNTPSPRNGWPIAIYGHGLGDNQFGAPTYIASTLAAAGFATLAFEIPGHGYGPNSTVQLTTTSGNTYTVQTPGRGVSKAANIGAQDGCVAAGAIAIRDCARQTAVDLFSLVKTIQTTNGLALGLDSDRIYYVGQSFGSIYGTLFHAVEPEVKTAVLNAGGGPSVDVARLALSGRPLGIGYLAGLGLLNVPPAPPEDYFHDNFNDDYPFRDRAPKAASVFGELAIQAAFEAAEWLGMLGDPLAFAPHLKTDPLKGVPAKSTLFQSSLGDLEVPNPTNSALIRAADGTESSILFRFDRALGAGALDLLTAVTLIDPTKLPGPGNVFPILPHRILSNPTIFDTNKPSETAIALAEQQTVAAYFQSDGQVVPNSNLFVSGPLRAVPLFDIGVLPPESLNFDINPFIHR